MSILQLETLQFEGMIITIQMIASIASVAAVTTRQPVVAVLYLVLLFSSVSIIIVMIGQGFMGLAYLIVYVGAIAILFLFVVILLNVKAVDRYMTSELRSQLYSAVMALAVTAAIVQFGMNEILHSVYSSQLPGSTVYQLNYVLYMPSTHTLIQELATVMFAPTELSLLVILIGVLLLVTMVACLTLCLRGE